MKKRGVIIVIILALVAGIVSAKDIIAKKVLTKGVQDVTGLELQIRDINVGLLKTLVNIQDLKLLNPRGFADKIMADIPQIHIDFDPVAFLKRKAHIETLRLNLKEIAIVRNERGELNLNALKPIQKKKEENKIQKEEKQKTPEIKIDSLELKIGKLIYKDYSKGTPPKVSKFEINFDEHFENIDSSSTLLKLIISALNSKVIAKLIDFDFGLIKDYVSQTIKETTEVITEPAAQVQQTASEISEKAKDTLEKTGEDIKKIFQFDE